MNSISLRQNSINTLTIKHELHKTCTTAVDCGGVHPTLVEGDASSQAVCVSQDIQAAADIILLSLTLREVSQLNGPLPCAWQIPPVALVIHPGLQPFLCHLTQDVLHKGLTNVRMRACSLSLQQKAHGVCKPLANVVMHTMASNTTEADIRKDVLRKWRAGANQARWPLRLS